MFKRKCYDKLLEWKRESNGRSAVLVEGARRVGKTTLVREFAEHEYADHIYIDFSKVPKVVLDLFRNEREDVDTFLRMLQLQYVKDMPVRESVIIFDEVQRSNMSKLGADGRPIHRADGKVLKGPDYCPPDIRSALGLAERDE